MGRRKGSKNKKKLEADSNREVVGNQKIEIDGDFFKLLRIRLRTRKDLRDGQVAEMADIDGSTLSALKTESRIKKPNLVLRMKLAIALARSYDEAKTIAREFVEAAPEIDSEGWDSLLPQLYVRLLQNSVRLVEISLPADLEMAPFWVAQEQGFFEEAGLMACFSHRDSGTNWGLYPQQQDRTRIKLAVFKREQIDMEPDKISFCCPLAVQVNESKITEAYGLACQTESLQSNAVRHAILQVIWVWYKAIKFMLAFPEQTDRSICELSRQYTNVPATLKETQAVRAASLFVKVAYPMQMVRLVESLPGYLQRRFDVSNMFVHYFYELEQLLP